MDRNRISTFIAPVLVLVSVLFVSGCQDERASTFGKGDGERSEKQTQREGFPKGHYWLNVKVDQFKGSYTLLCNGFPVKKMWVNVLETDDEWAADMQTALIGEENVASIRIRPFLDYSGKRLSVGTAQLEAWVEIEETRQSYVPLHKIEGAEGEGRLRSEAVDSAHTAWKKQAQKQWRRLLEETSTPKEAFVQLKTWRWENPIEVKTTPFTNRDGPDFSRIFEEAPVLEDTPSTRERLKDYAMRLRALMAEKDTSGLFEEFRPSIMARLKIHDVESRSEFLAKNRKGVILEDAVLDFGREDVRLRRWADGRIWEVWRAGSEDQLFFARPSGYGMSELYVAEIDGELRVVR